MGARPTTTGSPAEKIKKGNKKKKHHRAAVIIGHVETARQIPRVVGTSRSGSIGRVEFRLDLGHGASETSRPLQTRLFVFRSRDVESVTL